MADRIKIILKIAGREYPMTIDRNEEEKYRRAAKEVNELVTLFSKSYGLDSENYLAMAALQLAIMNINNKMSHDLKSVTDQLRAFDAELERVPGGDISGEKEKKR